MGKWSVPPITDKRWQPPHPPAVLYLQVWTSELDGNVWKTGPSLQGVEAPWCSPACSSENFSGLPSHPAGVFLEHTIFIISTTSRRLHPPLCASAHLLFTFLLARFQLHPFSRDVEVQAECTVASVEHRWAPRAPVSSRALGDLSIHIPCPQSPHRGLWEDGHSLPSTAPPPLRWTLELFRLTHEQCSLPASCVGGLFPFWTFFLSSQDVLTSSILRSRLERLFPLLSSPPGFPHPEFSPE